jgi:hypothetical protein
MRCACGTLTIMPPCDSEGDHPAGSEERQDVCWLLEIRGCLPGASCPAILVPMHRNVRRKHHVMAEGQE